MGRGFTSLRIKKGKFILACVLIFFSLLTISSCSRDKISNSDMKTFPISVKVSYETPKSLNLENDTSSGLELVSTATNLVVSVSNCASGYAVSSASIASGVVNLYKGDPNCLVKLISFQLGAVTYSTTGGTDFTTWLNNDVATFKDTVSSGVIKVFVISQLSQAGVQTSDTVVYKFTDIASSTTSNLGNVSVSTPVPLTVNGQAAPNFTVTQARYLSTNQNGSANMSFTLQCGNTLTGSTLSTYACSSALLNSQLDYILIPDAYAQGNIIVSQANTAFASHTTTSVGSLIVAPGGSDLNSNTLTNGGFYTSNSTPLTTGSTPIYPYGLSQVFMLRWRDAGGNTLSYLYFYVEINALDNNILGVSGCNTTFAGGAGTLANPYQIADATTLQNSQYCTSSSNYFVQTANIDLHGSNAPWTPIPLYGNYNGNGYTISNLYVSAGTTGDVGLFSTINSGASVSNLNISGASVSGGQNLGILAGKVAGGSVSSVTSSGTVSAGVNVENAGGLIGLMTSGSLSNSSSSANLTFNPSTSTQAAGFINVGGLFGEISASTGATTITGAAATGTVTVSSGTLSVTSYLCIGGFTGRLLSDSTNASSISQSYATGNVTGNAVTQSVGRSMFLGGFIGFADGGATSSTVSQSFAGGTITGVNTTNTSLRNGGFIGRNDQALISNSYSLGNLTLSGGGSSWTGGFVGEAYSPGSISTSYSGASSVTGTGTILGFYGTQGVSPAPTLTNNYFYDGPSVPSQTISGLTSYTTVTQMGNGANFTAAFDFSTPIWKMPSVNPLASGGLLSPVLAWQCGTNGITCYNALTTLANGSFEQGTLPLNIQNLAAGSTALTNWTIGGNIDVVTSGFWTTIDGTNTVELNGSSPGSISQSVATTSGVTYTVYFYMAGNFNCGGGIKSINVSAAGTTTGYSFDSTGKSSGNTGWVLKSFAFTANSSSTTLSFVSTNSGSCGPLVDYIH